MRNLKQKLFRMRTSLAVGALFMSLLGAVYLLCCVIQLEARMYTCGECRLHRFTDSLGSLVVREGTSETECSRWYNRQYDTQHRHQWVLCPLIQYRNLWGELKASKTSNRRELMWALTPDRQLSYLQNATGSEREQRRILIRKLFTATQKNQDQETRFAFQEIKQTLEAERRW